MPRLFKLLQLILMLAIAMPGSALASVTSGTVKGVVVDEANRVI